MRLPTARTRRVILGAIAPLLAGLPAGWAWGAPQGAHVIAGSAVVSSAGNTLLVRQSSDRAIINWANFSISPSETVQFVLPSASSAVLNRVISLSPSELNGTLQSNGIVYLINPSGILVGPHGVIDVHGFIASTLDASSQTFMSGGDLLFSGDSTAGVINRGVISTPGGNVVFIARQVGNNGQIAAGGGSVNLAGGGEVLLQQAGTPGITVRVVGGTGAVTNTGIIQSTFAQLTANGGNAMALAINNTGIVRATAVNNAGGHIYLTAGGAGQVDNNGTLDASSVTGHGGQIVVTGQDILIGSQSHLNAEGATGGGEILVGGSWENDDPTIAQAVGVMVQPGAILDASATLLGDGGTIVVRSDVTNPVSSTSVYGILRANAAGVGNGGRIETSGYSLETAGAIVSAAAVDGHAGEWLLDPYNLTISGSATSGFNTGSNPWVPTTSGGNVAASDIESALNGGSNVTISTGSSGSDLGNITDNAAIAKTSGSSAVTLELEANNNITINDNISSTSGALNLIFDAHQGTAGAIVLGANLTTNGGSIEFGTGRTSGGALVGGDVYFNGTSAQAISTSGGAVTFSGQILIANPSGLTITSGGADITFEGTVDSGDTYSLVNASVDWETAEVDAKGSTGGGAAVGDTYLATITSSLENTIASNAANYVAAWLGGSRVLGIGTNAVWRWVTGPEGLEGGGNGLPFFTSNFTGGGGTPINGAYTNWNGGEPNNSGGANVNSNGENALQFLGSNALWNDLSETTQFLPYLVETNLAPSALVVNAGMGHVTFNGFVGGNKALASLTVTGATAMNGGGVTTTGAQTYNNPVTLGASSTVLTVTSGNLNLTTNISYGGSSAASLSLVASGDVTVGADDAISANGAGALNVTLDSDSADTNGSGAGQIELLNGSSISSNGGTIVLGGGIDPTSDPAIGDISSTDGVYLDSTTINALGGNIIINGRGYSGGGIGLEVRDQPVDNNGTTIETTGIGTIAINAAGIGGADGFFMQEPNHLIQTQDGALTITASSSGSAIDWVRQTAGTGPNPLVQSTGSGVVTVTTTSGGVSINASTINTDNGNLIINSAGGIAMIWGATVQSFGSGAISLTSSGGEIQVGYGKAYIIGGTDSVTLTADSMDFNDAYDGAQNNVIQGSGALLIQPYTAGASIGVGDSSTGTLNLDSIDINAIRSGFSSITVGAALGSGAIDVTTAFFLAPVTIRTPMTGGTITVSSTLEADTNCSLTLQAGQDIVVNGGAIATNDAAITLDAARDGSQQGNIQIIDAVISSNGGAITLGGGVDPATTPAYGINGGGSLVNSSGVFINDSQLESSGGNISIMGDGSTAGTPDYAAGVRIEDFTYIYSGAGTINITGVAATGGTTGNIGVSVSIQNSVGSGGAPDTILSDSTSADAIVITGTGSTSGASNSAGFSLQDASMIVAREGSITINGTGGTFADDSTPGNHGINLDINSMVDAVNGNVTLNASSAAGIAAINNFDGGSRTIYAGGTLTLNPGNDGADLDSTELIAAKLLLTGPGSFTLTDASNSIGTIAGNVSAGIVQFTDSTSLIVGSINGTVGLTDTVGAVTLVVPGASSDITLDDAVAGAGSGSTVVLDAGGNFINDAGGSAIDAGSGRFLVYSTTPVDSVRDGLSGGELYDSTYTGNPPSGITASGNQFLYSVEPTLTFTATDKTKMYSEANPTLTYTVSGLVGTDTLGEVVSGVPLVSTAATSASGVGNYTIDIASNTLSSLIGYSLHFDDGNLSVTGAPLTITAVDKTKVYGASLPTLTANYSGFVHGDGTGVVSGLVLSTSALASSNVGAYAITASDATAADYNITFDPGTLTITKAALTITAQDKSKVYGAALPTLTASYTGLVNGDGPGAISGLNLSTSALASSNVGDYGITASGASSGNYNITLVPGTLTITQASLLILADNQIRDAGEPNPSLTATFLGLVNGDQPSSISGLTLTTAANTNSVVGSYPIQISGATNGNYAITMVDGTLFVMDGFTQSLRDQWQANSTLGPNFAPASITQPNVTPQAQTNTPAVIASAGLSNSGGNIFYRDRQTRGKFDQTVIQMGSDRIVLNTIIHVSSFDQPPSQLPSRIADIDGQ
jgi:filamentous hemagglutinin family protein